jgi:DNA-binding CsgD family transcriptional regulator
VRARQVLGEAVHIAAASGALRLELLATEELHLTGGRRRRRPYRTAAPGGDDGWAGMLTPAQLRVALLACDGLTNDEIGRRFVISARTVEHHLTGAYAALGVRGRRQLRRAVPGATS